MDVITQDRVIRDGKVAVLYSPGFGAGWSTWIDDPEVLFDPVIVGYVEKEDFEALETYMTMRYPDAYTGGSRDLTIEWIRVGTAFCINEYDGSESVEVKEDMNWRTA